MYVIDDPAFSHEVQILVFRPLVQSQNDAVWKRLVNLKDKIKEATQGSGLYAPLRDVYQFAFNRPSWQYRKRRALFYSQFVSKNDLVFDVGANVGDYTETFVRLGARVVAIEPNLQLVPLLKTVRPSDRVAVECMALGSREGFANLYLCGKNILATLSQEWIRVAKRSERFSGIEWNQKIAVPISTLDALIQKYGTPQFIKIDVEGFESEVLAGLSTTPRFLSFEFNSEFTEAAISCVAQDCFPSNTKFNVVVGLATEFIFDQWVCRDEILQLLENRGFLEAKMYGDIFVCGSR